MIITKRWRKKSKTKSKRLGNPLKTRLRGSMTPLSSSITCSRIRRSRSPTSAKPSSRRRRRRRRMAEGLTMVEALNLALAEEMRRDEKVLVMGEDVGVDGGIFRITKGVIDEFGEERVMDTPLAESGIVGTAI